MLEIQNDITHLIYYSINKVDVIDLVQHQSKDYLTIVDGNMIIGFQLNLGKDINPYKVLEVSDTVTKATLLPFINCILNAHQQLTLQEQSQPQQRYTSIANYILINKQLILIKYNPTSMTIQVIQHNTKIHQYQLATTEHIRIITSTHLLTDEHIITLPHPTQHISNPCYDTSVQKKYLSVSLKYIVYEIHGIIYSQKYNQQQQLVTIQCEEIVSCGICQTMNIFITLQNKGKAHYISLYSLQYGTKLISMATPLKTPTIIQITSHNINILETPTLQIFSINIHTLIGKQSIIIQPQLNTSHLYLMKQLNYRIKQLTTIKQYIQQNQLQAAIRIIKNEENASVVNDGIRLFYTNYSSCNSTILQIQLDIITVCQNMVNSKYENHIENALEILISIANKAVEKDIKNSLKNISKMKRIEKYIQQQKKKKLFELAYQFRMKVDSINDKFKSTY